MWFARRGTFWGKLGQGGRAYSDGLRQAGFPDSYAGSPLDAEHVIVVEPRDLAGQDRDPDPTDEEHDR